MTPSVSLNTVQQSAPISALIQPIGLCDTQNAQKIVISVQGTVDLWSYIIC